MQLLLEIRIMNYYKEIDIVKGVTILLVILGHCFCTHPLNLDEQLPMLARVVRSFQMPLFFVASGFLFSNKGGFGVFIKKKASRLVVPYLAFGFLSITLRYIFSSFTNGGTITWIDSLLKLLNGEYYWFLYTLLLVMILMQLLNRQKFIYAVSVSCVVLCLLTDARSINIMTLGKVVYYLSFFGLGIWIKQNYSSLLAIYAQRRSFIGMCTTGLFALSFINTGGGIGGLIEQYINPLLGVIMAWIASMEMANRNWKLCDVFVHFGHYSLQYYLNHLLIMLPLYYMASKLSSFHPLIPLFVIFVCAVAISFIMLKVEKSMRITRFLCALK